MAKIKLNPRPVSRPWGGSRLSSFCGFAPTGEVIGEAYIHEGDLAPALLLKWLDAAENLSIQNHPSETGYSKREAWYFVKPPDSGRVITGIDCALDAPDIEDHIVYTDVQQGSILELPAGCVHSLTPGALVLEVQEPLDVTYRIYDWGRGRDVHLQKAAESLTNEAPKLHAPLDERGQHVIVQNSEFQIVVLNGAVEWSPSKKGVLSFVDGRRQGENYLIDEAETELIESAEKAVWVTV